MDKIQELYAMSKELDILFVEDDDELRMQMEDMFNELFRQVDTAENGINGLQRYQDRLNTLAKPYDLIITDINMPEMNGIELIHAIYEINPSQPIIVVSAHNESDYLMELLYMGIDSFLIKPVKHDKFIKTLYKVARSIINERLVEKHYKEIESLNEQLNIKSEALKKSNDEMHEKNIALEKSMRIIERMQHERQANRNADLPTYARDENQKQAGSSFSQEVLQNIEDIIGEISIEVAYKNIKDKSLQELSSTIQQYAASLSQKQEHRGLASNLEQLAITLQNQPKYTSREELDRIFSMLEGFFFIYTKWEKEWEHIDVDDFQLFSLPIEEEISALIDAWNCKVKV